MDDPFDPDLAALFGWSPPAADSEAFARRVVRRIRLERGLRAIVVFALTLLGSGAALVAAGFGRHPQAAVSSAGSELMGWLAGLAGPVTLGGGDQALWLWLFAAAAVVVTLVAGRLIEET